MSRAKGKQNTAQNIIDEIFRRNKEGESVPSLAKIYAMPFKTVRNMIYRERRKQKELELTGRLAGEQKRGRKQANSLQEYKYENSRLKMENELLRNFLRAAGRK